MGTKRSTWKSDDQADPPIRIVPSKRLKRLFVSKATTRSRTVHMGQAESLLLFEISMTAAETRPAAQFQFFSSSKYRLADCP